MLWHNDQALYSKKEAAERIGCHTRTITGYIMKKMIAPRRLKQPGGRKPHVFFTEREIERMTQMYQTGYDACHRSRGAHGRFLKDT